MGDVSLSSRIADAVNICERTGTPRFLGFLSSEQAAQAVTAAQGTVYSFFGGYDDAQRLYFAVWPDWCEPDNSLFPVDALTFTYRRCDRLGHRDILGTLMSLGIERDCVGDILLQDGRAVVFLSREISAFVESSVLKVGGTGVTVTRGFEPPLPEAGSLVDASDTVASVRLDCIVSSLGCCSRSAAAALIEDGRVSVNGICVEKISYSVSAGDKITVRGKGKFNICSVAERSKKGRVILKYQKYV